MSSSLVEEVKEANEKAQQDKDPSSDQSSSAYQQLDKSLVISTKDAIYELYKPMIYEIEQCCGNLKTSQTNLNKELEDFLQLLRELKCKFENDKLSEQLDENAKKIIGIKRKLTLIHTIIQNSDDRCKRLIAKYMTKDLQSTNDAVGAS